MARNRIIIFCAHSDDQILGAGGTAAKYAKEGADIHTVIFSYGEGSHFWIKGEITSDIRVKEAKNADKIIKGNGVTFLGLTEGKFREQTKKKNLKKKVREIIEKIKPTKIFTHSKEDPHKDHYAVHDFILDTLNKMKYKCDVYSFDIWNPSRIKRRDHPKLVVDISETFRTKIKALKCFKGEKFALFWLFPTIYIKAISSGFQNHFRYAETFIKER
ncbi:PIG-L family deacetylase [Candidatus Woesearchaeota archaeon]|nr:PIG-L family deacetylase [Candidatus Woesearchaeota archaeon]